MRDGIDYEPDGVVLLSLRNGARVCVAEFRDRVMQRDERTFDVFDDLRFRLHRFGTDLVDLVLRRRLSLDARAHRVVVRGEMLQLFAERAHAIELAISRYE